MKNKLFSLFSLVKYCGLLMKYIKMFFYHIFSSFKFAFIFIFSNPEKTRIENLNLKDWLMTQLKNDSKMIIVAGELGLAINSPEVVDEIEEAVTKRNKKIKIFCGPKISTKNGENKLYDYLLTNTPKNIEVKGASIENMPLFHYIVNGRNVLIERPHLPSEALNDDLQICTISNSVIWHYRLSTYFTKLFANSTLTIKNLNKANIPELISFENSHEFAKIKERIIESKRH